jgi:hypothetical protein
MKDKLELKDIAPYLPYGLKFKSSTVGVSVCIIGDGDGDGYCNESVRDVDLEFLFDFFGESNVATHYNTDFGSGFLLRPLSDLTKEIEVDGEKFMPEDKINKELLYNCGILNCNDGIISLQFQQGISNKLIAIAGEVVPECPLGIYNKLIEWHFDVNDLIGRGLAIKK